MAGIIILVSGCGAYDYLTYKPIYCISVHQIKDPYVNPKESLRIHEVADISGKESIFVSTFWIVDSSCFGDCMIIRGSNGKWGLRFLINRKGKDLWRQACLELRGQKVAILQDGFLVGTMDIPKRIDEANSDFFDLPPLWSEEDARKIAAHTKINFDRSRNK